ncbi:uncharacterized protein CDAR_365801 [Caerostris darwini]|uniref:Cuticle protein 16.8 n=1 Tax=Caerostris darwini TaxID=1538125 RepID=A0AAV4MT24_9ARAC|nr:uncharacterized protein CDAR_365801 [Caerostris darwini]
MLFLVVLSTIALAHGSIVHHIVPHHAPQPYKFGYSIKDHHGEQHRQEAGNGAGAVVGNYGFTDDRGIARQVNYVADHAGFRAQVKTNEPGTANQNPAAVQVISNTPYVAGVSAYVPVGPAVVGHGPVVGLRAGYGYGHGYGYGRGYGGNVQFGLASYQQGLAGGAIRGYDGRLVNFL